MRMILDYPAQIRAGEVALQRIKALGAFADHSGCLGSAVLSGMLGLTRRTS